MKTKITKFHAVLCKSIPPRYTHLFQICSHTPSVSLAYTDKTGCTLYLTRYNSRACDLQKPVNWRTFIYSRHKVVTDGYLNSAPWPNWVSATLQNWFSNHHQYRWRTQSIKFVTEYIANAPSASQLHHNQCAVTAMPPPPPPATAAAATAVAAAAAIEQTTGSTTLPIWSQGIPKVQNVFP